MKLKTVFAIVICLLPLILTAQVVDKEEALRKPLLSDTINGWKRGAVINVNFTQTSLNNWSAGGQSSLAFNELANFYLHYKKHSWLWENYLDIGYGLASKGDTKKWIKTDDKIDITTKYGQKAFKKVYYAALLNIKTQMVSGYKSDNDSLRISDFLSPAYIVGALGFDNKPSDNFSIFLAPITGKVTYIRNNALAAAGAFGVDPGKHLRSEFGGYLRFFMKKEIMTNTTLQTKLDLFSNYFKNPLNIDVNVESILSMKVNKWISTSLFMNAIYDDDIKISTDKNGDGVADVSGPRTQFKEIFGLGINYSF